MLRQYVLTRFNLRLWRRNKYLKDTLTEAWLTKRFELFETYCLPSLAAQTQPDFVWIVLFDKATPEAFVKRAQALKDKCPQFLPVLVRSDASWDFPRIFGEVINVDLKRQREKGRTIEKIATTYLDNDDTLAIDHIERVRAAAEQAAHGTFITFLYGLQYFEELNIATRIRYNNNHFLTYVERLDDHRPPQTVFGFGSHAYVYKFPACQVQEINTKDAPAWVENIHRTNVSNDVIMRRRTPLMRDRHILQKRFAVNIVTREDAARVFYTTYMYRWVREFFRHIFVKVLVKSENLWYRFNERRPQKELRTEAESSPESSA